MLGELIILGLMLVLGMCVAERISDIVKGIRELSIDIQELKLQKCRDHQNASVKEYLKYEHEIEQVLGKALGYPPYPIRDGWDYSENPARQTDKPDSEWVCVGDSTALSLADEAAAKIRQLMEKQ